MSTPDELIDKLDHALDVSGVYYDKTDVHLYNEYKWRYVMAPPLRPAAQAILFEIQANDIRHILFNNGWMQEGNIVLYIG